MTDKFKPLDSNPRYVYHVDYWSTVAQDTFESFWNLVIWAFTGRFPVLLVTLSNIVVTLNAIL
jgi:hypothetical protein